MIRCQKTRIYPTPEQAQLLDKSFDVARFAWNTALQESLGTKVYSGYTLRNQFVKLVKPKRDWLAEVSKDAYANSILDLGKAWKAVFDSARGTRKGKRVGQPNFKAKKNAKQSFRVESARKNNLTWIGKELKAPKFTGKRGYLPKIKTAEAPRWANGEVKAITFSRNGEKYFVSVRFDVPKPKNTREPHTLNGGTVGIDWGVKTLLTLSDGTVFNSPDYRKIDRQIRKAQRRVSRKELGSKNREKAKVKLLHKTNHKVNMIEDTLHKATTFIVQNYNLIKIEDLRSSNMMKNHSLARKIAEASFYKFKTMLIYKAEQLQIEYGGNVAVELVNPRNTSQICSSCGNKAEVKLELKDRIFNCKHCGMSKDRDLNAAINILHR